jgi:PilZ domain
MKHEAIVAGDEWPQRDPRVDVEFDVCVHGPAGEVEAQIINLSADGFRLQTANPLQVGWEVTLEASRQFPVRALICWACGLESGGVFAEAVTL